MSEAGQIHLSDCYSVARVSFQLAALLDRSGYKYFSALSHESESAHFPQHYIDLVGKAFPPSEDTQPASAENDDISESLFLTAILHILFITVFEAPLPVSPEYDTDSLAGSLRSIALRKVSTKRLVHLAILFLESILYASSDSTLEQRDKQLLNLVTESNLLDDTRSTQVYTSAIDILLQLVSFSLSPGLNQATPMRDLLHPLISHSVVLAASERVWDEGALDRAPRGNAYKYWKPLQLHLYSVIMQTMYFVFIIYLALFSEYHHYHKLNPLVSYDRRHPTTNKPGHESRGIAALWWIFVTFAAGYAIEIFKTVLFGPLPHIRSLRTLPLPLGALTPIIGHSLVALSVFLRLVSNGGKPLVSLSFTFLSWSLPFLGLSAFILPSHVPALNPSYLHLKTTSWRRFLAHSRFKPDLRTFAASIHDTPPLGIANSVLAQRSLGLRLDGLKHAATFLAIFVFLLVLSLRGAVDINDPATIQIMEQYPGRVSPLEARSAIAVALIAGLVIAWLSGGLKADLQASRRSQRSPSSSDTTLQEISHLSSDLDGLDATYGPEIATQARLERLRVIRYFAYSSPPTATRWRAANLALVPPFNLLAFIFRSLPCFLLSGFSNVRTERAKERWRIWVNDLLWWICVAPVMILLFGWQGYFV